VRLLAFFAFLLSAAATVAQMLPQGSGSIGPLRRDPDGKIVPGVPELRGPGRSLKADGDIALAIERARNGDTIEIGPGLHTTTFAVRASNVTIRGVGGRPHISCAGLRLSSDKACILLVGDNITLENLEISGAEISESLGANAACLRNEPGRNFTLHGIICHSSQNGLLTSGGSVLIEGSEFYDNSWTGQTHNVYLSGDCPLVTVRNSIFRDARVAHEFKSRCRKTVITDSTFRSRMGSRTLDISDGGDTLIANVTIFRASSVSNADIIGFAPEGCRFSAPMRVIRSRIVNEHPHGSITNYGKCEGQPIVLEGVSFEGVRPQLRGYVQEK
jgi:hypothetical protein